jgi:hypothetical protein
MLYNLHFPTVYPLSNLTYQKDEQALLGNLGKITIPSPFKIWHLTVPLSTYSLIISLSLLQSSED